MRFLTSLAAISLAVLGAPAMASDGGITCMEEGYDTATLGQIEQLMGQVDIEAGDENIANAKLGQLVIEAVQFCIAEHGWNELQTFNAIIYEIGRLQELAMRQNGPLTPQEISNLDKALANGDRTQLWTIVEAQAQKGMVGEAVDVSDREAMILGMFIVAAGIPPTEEAGEDVGLLLGMMALQRIGAREFAAMAQE